MAERLATLKRLASAYFHQDWDLEGLTARQTLIEVATPSTPDLRVGLLIDLQSIDLDELSEEAAVRLWREVSGGNYLPPDDGVTTVEWFRTLRRLVLEAAEDDEHED